MPREDQQTLTIPKWLWDLAEKYFKEHEEELKQYGIRSTTGVIRHWVEEALRDGSLPKLGG